eukprot:gene9480-1686_t
MLSVKCKFCNKEFCEKHLSTCEKCSRNYCSECNDWSQLSKLRLACNTDTEESIAEILSKVYSEKLDYYDLGQKQLKEIGQYQNSTGLLIPVSDFKLVVEEVISYYSDDLEFEPEALEQLQIEADSFIVELFETTLLEAIHARRDIITLRDMKISERIRNGLCLSRVWEPDMVEEEPIPVLEIKKEEHLHSNDVSVNDDCQFDDDKSELEITDEEEEYECESEELNATPVPQWNNQDILTWVEDTFSGIPKEIIKEKFKQMKIKGDLLIYLDAFDLKEMESECAKYLLEKTEILKKSEKARILKQRKQDEIEEQVIKIEEEVLSNIEKYGTEDEESDFTDYSESDEETTEYFNEEENNYDSLKRKREDEDEIDQLPIVVETFDGYSSQPEVRCIGVFGDIFSANKKIWDVFYNEDPWGNSFQPSDVKMKKDSLGIMSLEYIAEHGCIWKVYGKTPQKFTKMDFYSNNPKSLKIRCFTPKFSTNFSVHSTKVVVILTNQFVPSFSDRQTSKNVKKETKRKMINQEYKQLKEDALINLKGSSITESFILSLTMPFTILLHYIIFKEPKYENNTINKILNIICHSFPFIITFTFWTESYPFYFSIIFVLVALYIIMNPKRFQFLTKERVEELNQKRKFFISTYRISKMLGVCITILVVDFPLSFDRRLSKCETYGISMMDLGVGTFIFSSAMISTITSRSIMKILKSVGPMIVLGILRFLSVTITNYPVHMTEYGTHWNFFFTLAAISISINLIGHSKNDLYLGILAGVAHEILLRNGLETYIMDPNRVSFIDHNKEGICTLLAYISIYYIASSFGKIFLKERTREEWKNLLIRLWILTILFLIPVFLWEKYFLFSRRLGNLGYILAIVGQNFILVTLNLTISMFTNVHDNLMVNIVNSNPLIFFLIANLFTGIINFVFDTLTIKAPFVFVILTGYAFATTYTRLLSLKLMKSKSKKQE